MSTGARKRLFTSPGGPGATTVTVSPARRVRTVAPRTTALRGRVVRGFTRRSGFYGRFGRGGELKFFDTAISFLIDATSEVPATGQLVLIPQGVTESTRVGRKCVIKSIQMRLNLVFAPAASATAATAFSIWLVQDKQANGAAAAITDVITSSNLTSGMRDLSNSGRFIILKRWNSVMNVGAGVTTAFNNSYRHIEFFKTCNIPIEYSSTTGAIGEIKSNNLFLLAGANGSDDLITVAGNCRVRFSDN